MNGNVASTSCADSEVVNDGDNKDKSVPKCDESSSKTNTLSSDASNNCVTQGAKTSVPSKTCGASNPKNSNNGKFKPQKFVKEGEKIPAPKPSHKTCSCDCKNTSGLQNDFYPKKQTCYNCGIAGHIARNCPHRPYVPYYAQEWENMPRGRSSKRNPSRSHSRDGDWTSHKDKRTKNQVGCLKDLERDKVILQLLSKLLSPRSQDQNQFHRSKDRLHRSQDKTQRSQDQSQKSKKRTTRSQDQCQQSKTKATKVKKEMTNMKSDERDNFTKPNSVKSSSSQGSSSSSHLKNKPKAQGGQNSSSSVETPIRLNYNLHKTDYRWVPKSLASKLTHNPVVSSILSYKQDMPWEQVKHVDGNGKPSFKMDWVPKTN